LNRADPEANCLCHSIDADTLGKLGSCLAQLVWIGIRTAEALFDLDLLRDEVPLTLIWSLARFSLALTRVRIIERSNSAKAPVI
jgi:hypothetical protein